MSRICTICARGGSQGVKNKNIRELAGKPLIAHSIIQAKESKLFEAIAVSSDSDEILDIAKTWGVDLLIKRPVELATDYAPKIPAIRHCVQEVEKITDQAFDVVIDLDVTSPLRNVCDIHEAIKLMEQSHVSNVITGTPARRSPYFNMVELDENAVVKLSKPLSYPIYRRQDAPACYDLNASIYVWKYEALFKNDTIFNDDTLLYVMPAERSIDIDSELDFAFVNFLLNKK